MHSYARSDRELVADRELLVDETGDYSGQLALARGTVLLGINAIGTWTITPD